MKKIVILGGGESGVGAALLAKKKGHPVFVSDHGTLTEKYRQELEKNDIPYEENKHTSEIIFAADIVIKSPGIPDHLRLIQELQKAEIPVISEIEYAGKHTNSVIIAITGSNGKTTTTNLTHHLLQTAGFNVGMGGNVGNSFARMVADDPHDYYVLELSSFQLDGIEYFQPDVAILLNITPDHLDRYDYKLEKYIQSKFRIQKNQESEDLFIYNGLDQNIKRHLDLTKIIARTVAIEDDFYNQGFLVLGGEPEFDLRQCSLKGPHNFFNAICAVHAALSQGAAKKAIQKGLDTFINVPHRLELVATHNGIDFINDSKATNLDAVYHALLAMEKPTILIIGGVDKGNDYQLLMPLVKEKVKALVCLGIDNEKIKTAFKDVVHTIIESRDMKTAIYKSNELAKVGDTILLSPACSSFDLFKNYIDRGDQFRTVVQEMIA